MTEAQRRRLIFVPLMLDTDAVTWWEDLQKQGKLTSLSKDYQYETFFDTAGRPLDITPGDALVNGLIARLGNRIKRDLVLQGGEPAPNPSPTPPPPAWGIALRTETFKGRDKELKKLSNLIRQGGFVAVNGSVHAGRRTLVAQVADVLHTAGELPGSGVWVNCDGVTDYEALVLKVAALVLRGREQPDARDCDRILQDQFRRQRTLVILDAVHNPDEDHVIEDWARRVPSPSCAVYLARKQVAEANTVWLRYDLDPESAAELFRERARREVPATEFRDQKSSRLIARIVERLRFHPFLIEIYARKCGTQLLADILNEAESNKTKNVEDVWGEELKPQFDALDDEHRQAFLVICQLPGQICREVIKEVTRLDTVVLGKAVRQQILWSRGSNDRYDIEGYVRDFAKQRLGGPTEVSGAEKRAAEAFACAANKQAGLIDKIRAEEDVEEEPTAEESTADEALDWFEHEWTNVKWCCKTADRYGDTKTLFVLADSLVQFMLARGHLDECKGIYTSVEEARRRDDPLGHARTLNDLAVCLQFKHDFVEAAKKIEQCIKIRTREQEAASRAPEAAGQRFELAKSWNTCGAIDEGQAWSLREDKKRQAIELLLKAAKAYDQADSICKDASGRCEAQSMIAREIEVERSQTLSNVGQCNARLYQMYGADPRYSEERKKARRNAENAFVMSLGIPRPHDWRVYQTHSRQAWLYSQEGKWPLAKDTYLKALKAPEDGLLKNPLLTNPLAQLALARYGPNLLESAAF